jgi:hypothetical protein
LTFTGVELAWQDLASIFHIEQPVTGKPSITNTARRVWGESTGK